MSGTVAVSVPPPTPTRPAEREQFWRETSAAFAASGLSVRGFCRAHGLHEKRFYTWRRNLGLSPVARTTPSHPDPNPTFVPLRVVSEVTAEVVLPGGLSVRLPVSADPAHVARLVVALRSNPC